MSNRELYDELLFYTLSHKDQHFFIHQLAVDAYALQNADENTKRISVVYALVTMYLVLEKGKTGKEAQLAHIQLSKDKSNLPDISPLSLRGEISIADVMKQPEGKKRDEKIKEWCASVWTPYAEFKNEIASYLESHQI